MQLYNYSFNDTVYNITLTATNPFGCDSSIMKPVTVYAYINADFTVENQDSCSPFPIQITNNSPAGVDEHFWDFGDGSPISNTANPTHTYRNTALVFRNDTLELVVKNTHNCYDTLQKIISVYPEMLASFDPDNTEGCNPLIIGFICKTYD